MSKFKFTKNGKDMYVKKIDRINHSISFTENANEAYDRDGSYYPNAERDYIIFHFGKQYPELKNLVLEDDGWW